MVAVETHVAYWDPWYLLRPAVAVETCGGSWDPQYLLRPMVPIETHSTYWELLYLLRLAVPVETCGTYCDRRYLLRPTEPTETHGFGSRPRTMTVLQDTAVLLLISKKSMKIICLYLKKLCLTKPQAPSGIQNDVDKEIVGSDSPTIAPHWLKHVTIV